MTHPLKISIITPSFNQAAYLEHTMASVLSQRYPNLEYIVIDGGSRDESAQIIDKYRLQLAYSVSEPDGGHAEALNKGFRVSSGEIMAWLNSDDMYYPWTLATVASVFSQLPEVEWIVGVNSWFDAEDALITTRAVRKNIYDFLLGRYHWIQQESVFWRRSLWDRAGGMIDERMRFMVDGELWTRFFLHADLYHVDRVLGGYRTHDTNRARHNMDAIVQEMNASIDILKDRCPKDILDTLTHLNAKQTPNIFSRYPLNRLYRRLNPLGSALTQKTSYKNVGKHARVWHISQTEFEV